jgi:hypothetical protein
MNLLIQIKTANVSLLATLMFACFGLLPKAQAVVPAPDGGYGEDQGYGPANTAEGEDALFSLFGGDYNTAIGFNALYSTVSGEDNTAVGASALYSNTEGEFNTAVGDSALYSNTTGEDNTAIGSFALGNYRGVGDNTAMGAFALSNLGGGFGNIALGSDAGENLLRGTDNIYIGNPGLGTEVGIIRIGVKGTHVRAFIAGISGSPITGTTVVVNSNGRLGTVASSQRFKDDIKPMDKASEAILVLKPVTFHYKKEIDPDGIPQFGLVAEDVAKVNADLVTRDSDGKVYTVRYEAVNAMLLNEFIKEHKTVQEQDARLTKQEALIARQQKQIETLAAGLQKVSAQLQLNKPGPQTVLNNR